MRTTSSFQFELIKVRLDRAHQHLNTLEDRIEWMGESNPYRIGINRDSNTRSYFVTAAIPQAPPYEWSFLISELCHNLRAALDNLVWQLALKRTTAPYDRAAFPIYISPSGFQSGGNHLVIDLSPVQRAMVERTQPYHRRYPNRDPLWLLHQINNADKHRFLPVVAQPKFDLGTLSIDGPTQDLEVFRPSRMENGTRLARFTPAILLGNQEAQVQVDIDGSLEVRFAETLQDFSRRQVLPLMWQIFSRVFSIVHRFERQLSL